MFQSRSRCWISARACEEKKKTVVQKSSADLLADFVLDSTVLFDLNQVLLALLFCSGPRSAGYAVLGDLKSASVTRETLKLEEGFMLTLVMLVRIYLMFWL